MKRPQFSLWWLLGFTTFAAIGCLALVNASNTWAMLLNNAVLGLLLLAILRAIYRDGPVRAFWVGFAVWGWIYLALAFGSLQTMLSTGPFSPGDSVLATMRLSERAYVHLLPKVRTPPQWNGMGGMGAGMGGMGMGSGGMAGAGGDLSLLGLPPGSVGGLAGGMAAPANYYPDQYSFHRVAHELWAFVLAMIGGWTARYLSQTRTSRASPPAV